MIKKYVGLFQKWRSVISFMSGSLFVSVSQLIGSIVIISFINPGELGLWNSVILFQTYSLLLQGGIINGLNRELPYYLGKNDQVTSKSLASTALFVILISIALCFTAGAGILIYNHGQNIKFILTVVGVLIVTLSLFYENYLSSTFRSNHSFGQLSWIYFLKGGLVLLSVIFVVYFGYWGYITRFVFISVITTIALHIIRPLKVKPRFVWDDFKTLLKVGLPIFVLAYIYSSSGTLDRVFLIKYSNAETVGFYSIGIMALGAFSIFPISLSNYIYPKLSFIFGQTNNVDNMTKKAFQINAIVLILMLPLALVGYFLLPVIITSYYPKYIPGILAAQILVFAGVFTGSSIGINIFWSMKKWIYILISQLSGALFNVIFIFSGLKLFENIMVGVSVGVLFSQIAYFTLTNVLIYIVDKNERYSGTLE